MKDMTIQDRQVKFANAWTQFETVVSKSYLETLKNCSVTQNKGDFDEALKQLQMCHIVKIVYDKDENTLAKLNNVFSAMCAAKSAVYVLLQNTGGKSTNVYLGVQGNDAGGSVKSLERAANGNFPGITLKRVDHDNRPREHSVENVVKKMRENDCLGIVTGVPSLKENTEDSFSQGLEKIIDAMGDRKYTALFLANPIDRNTLLTLEQGYQNLYSNLSMLNMSSVSLSEQQCISIGQSISESFSEALSESLSLATTETAGSSYSKSKGKTTNPGAAAAAGCAAAGAIVGSVFPGVGTLFGGAVGGAVGGIVGGMIGSCSENESDGINNSMAKGKTLMHGKTSNMSDSVTETKNASDTKGITYQYEMKNRRVVDALKILEEQLERIRVAKSYGAWNWASYFLADDIDTVKIGAEVYSGILRGEKTGVEHCAISYVTKSKKDKNDNVAYFNAVLSNVSCMKHPVFRLNDNVLISPTAMITTQELSVGMALPQKSVPGLPVFESVEFGRSVTTYDSKDADKDRDKSKCCCIGNVSHMGTESENNKVELDVKSLTAHTFVTGSTGSGKSNTVYTLLTKLENDCKVPFLVIEPAKGEYKNVFGDANVYGTNPMQTKLLRINPFSFPDGIHVTEHIDRLIEILNAVWPMYAAMPAILKEAVELTYRNCGWNLLTSKNEYTPAVYPDFTELLEALPKVIDDSKYAAEVKSNYTGSLVTRVKSLTNGYYRNIFQKDELPPRVLFDESCIVDLSRVGSSETKSMLMGIVFMKLQEYRMSSATDSNVGLKHVTVLEEAHNLLRRTGMEQGQESANLQGKAVEMITNAIAEMRTYGEGFIIADQAPGLLDPSVIRNTNTKIVLRLPDYDDRVLVGKAENLNDDQIEELARLKTGCAAVYQNNWQQAVLCQIEEFKETSNKKFVFKKKDFEQDSRIRAEDCFLKCVAKCFNGKSLTLSEGEKALMCLYYPRFAKHVKEKTFSSNEALKHFGEFIALGQRFKEVQSADKTELPRTKMLVKKVFAIPALARQNCVDKDILLQGMFTLLKNHAHKNPETWQQAIEHFEQWRVW